MVIYSLYSKTKHTHIIDKNVNYVDVEGTIDADDIN